MRWILSLAAFAVLSGAAKAEVPLTGVFQAERSCDATPAIRSFGNPGAVRVSPGSRWEIIARNSTPGTHYLIRVPGAAPERRWVAMDCGHEMAGGQTERSVRERDNVSSGDGNRFILAVTWHPAFCESLQRAADCRSGGQGGGFTLHGLWPQPRGREYCGVSQRIRASDENGRWRDLPAVQLTPSTRRDLARVMPGTLAALDRHQWWKHGTCFGTDAETYFKTSIRLIDALNTTGVARLFQNSIGRELDAREVREAFTESFGRGAGERVALDCAEAQDGRRLISELRIAIGGRLEADNDLSVSIGDGESQPRGCRGGLIDAPGFD